MKRLAGGRDVREDSEPWFGTLVRIDRPRGQNRTATNRTSSASKKRNARQESGVGLSGDSDSTLDIINYNNALQAAQANNSEPSLYSLDSNDENSRPFCGSTLISDRYVITAASCVHGLRPDQFLVILNLYSLKPAEGRDQIRVRPDKVIIHPNYDQQVELNNVALIRLRRTIEFRFDLNVVPLCLPQVATAEPVPNRLDYYPGTMYTLGYGRLYNASLTGGPLSNSLNNLASSLAGAATAIPQPPKDFPNRLQIVHLRQEFLWCFLFYSSKYMENQLCTNDNRIIHLTVRDVCEKGWCSFRLCAVSQKANFLNIAHYGIESSIVSRPFLPLLIVILLAKDTGGPLVWFNSTMNAKTLIGISQTGARSGWCTGIHPPIFTRIKPFLAWIDRTTSDSEYCRFTDLN